MSWMDYDLVNAITMACIHSLWQGVLILGLVAMIKKALHSSNSLIHYWLYFGGLCAMMLFWILTFCYYQIPSNTIGTDGESWQMIRDLGLNNSGILTEGNRFYYLLAFIWMIGSIFCLGRAILGTLFLHRIKHAAKPVPENWKQQMAKLVQMLKVRSQVVLKHSSAINVPMVVGIFNPVVLLPSFYFNHLSAQHLEAVLIHELIHIKRHDYLLNQIQVLIESLLFYHPVTWIIGRRIRQNREYICDDQVKHNVQLSSYLETLYQIANFSTQNMQLAPALYNHKNELIMRVKRMLNRPIEDIHLKPIVYVLLILVIVFSQYAFRQSDFNDQIEKVADLSIQGQELVVEIPRGEDNAKTGQSLVPEKEQMVSSPKSLKVNQPKTGSLKDTLPSTKKIKDLEKKIAKKEQEIEMLSNRISQEMESKMQLRMKDLQAQREQLEKQLEPKIKKLEALMESENREKMQEFERKQFELEKQMKESMNKLEKQMKSAEFKQLEQQIEQNSQQLEALQALPKNEENLKKAQDLTQEIQEYQKKMQHQMQEFQNAHQKLMQNPEMQQLQNDIQEFQLSMQEFQQEHQKIWNQETMEMQKKMNQLQHEIQQEMQTINQEVHQQMQQKSMELQELYLELQKAKRSQKHN